MFFVELGYESLHIFCDHCMYVGHRVDKCWKFKGKNVEKLLIKEYTPKKSEQIILVNDNVKDIENNEFVNSIENGLMNDDFVDLNKA